jgi:hypothetical protein
LAVREEGLSPTLISEENLLKKSPEIKKSENKDEWAGITLREALTKLRGEDVSIQIHGRGRVKRYSRSEGRVLLELD